MESMNISFAGCGFLGIYHIGAASCIKEYAPHLLANKISGASIGAVTGTCLLADVSLGVFCSELLHVIYEVCRRPLGPFNPLTSVQSMLRNFLINSLPNNAYEIVSGRLFVSMTRVNDGSNYILSEFKSNAHLIEALLASAFVPIFSGFIPPKLGKYRYFDGGFSNNLPVLDEHTITVSPFCGEADICPRDASVQLFHINLYNTSLGVSKRNICRLWRILFPPSPEVLSQMCKQGFDDALKFLQRNNMISCTKCLSVQRTVSLTFDRHERKHQQDESCDSQREECVHRIPEATSSNLPEVIMKNFEALMDTYNKVFANWLYHHRSLKIVYVVSWPCFLMADFILATLKKLTEIAPELMGHSAELCKQWINILIEKLNEINKTEKQNITRRKEIMPRKEVIQLDFDPDIVINTMESDATKDEQSFVLNFTESTTLSDDAYEDLIETIDHHDSLMAFYYMDDSDKMNVVEFFDMRHDNIEECRDTGAKQTDSKEIHNHSNHRNHNHHPNAHHHLHTPATLSHTYMNGWKLENGDISSVMHSAEDDNSNSVSNASDSNDQGTVFSDPENDSTRKHDQILNQVYPENEERFHSKPLFNRKSSKSIIVSVETKN